MTKKKGRMEWVTFPDGTRKFMRTYPVEDDINRELCETISLPKKRGKGGKR